jgi:hypothetical protein
MWYSNVLIELFQVVIITYQRGEKCVWKFYLSSQFFQKPCLALPTCNFGTANLQLWHCQPATLPTHFPRTFSSKLVGMRGWGEPDQFVRKFWISCRLQ